MMEWWEPWLRSDAHKRSFDMLMERLNPEEQERFRHDQEICVTGSNGGDYILYLYRFGSRANEDLAIFVAHHDLPRISGFLWHRLCIYPDTPAGWTFPWPDQALALLMAISADETSFRRVARSAAGADFLPYKANLS